jgi:hypothetical protein
MMRTSWKRTETPLDVLSAERCAVIKVIFLVVLIFSPFAAAIAFIITYEEYSKHLVDKREVLRISLRMALVTLVFFLTVPTLLIWLFMK